MKKITKKFGIITLVAAFTFMVLSNAASAATTANDGVHIMVMTHLCDSSIKNVQDFENMENGKSPVANLANDVLHCPTTGLPKDAAVAGTVASPRTTYDFSVQSGNGRALTLQNDGVYEPHKVCESDVNIDVDGDGKILTTTCLDISHYKFHIPDGGSSFVNVKETSAPTGFHFGILRFTPIAIDSNNDSETLSSIDSANGKIDVNLTPDKDGMVMLHIYQFRNSNIANCMIGGRLHVEVYGTEVSCFQSYLIAQGYLTGTPSGNFDDMTKSAVVNWQLNAGLGGDGIIGPMSRMKFNSR